jgi:hypothetical protein
MGLSPNVTGFFYQPNPSSRTMALESIQPLTEMSTRNVPGDKGRLARKADNLTAICEPTVWKMWEPRHLETLWACMVCYRDSFTFFFGYIISELQSTKKIQKYILMWNTQHTNMSDYKDDYSL